MAGYDGDPGPLPPSPPRRAGGNRWVSAPATYILVGINCAVYVAMVLRGVSPLIPTFKTWCIGGQILAVMSLPGSGGVC